jgi:geranylgeranyl pyrophosphate synthase
VAFKSLTDALDKKASDRMRKRIDELTNENERLEQCEAVIKASPSHASYRDTRDLLNELRKHTLDRVRRFVPDDQWDTCRKEILFVMGDRYAERRLKEIFGCGEEPESVAKGL